jgi:hypothetical protein
MKPSHVAIDYAQQQYNTSSSILSNAAPSLSDGANEILFILFCLVKFDIRIIQ